MIFSACVEMLFAKESDDPAHRIRLAAQAGFEAIEFWRWTNKDLGAIRDAVSEGGVKVTGMVAEPMIAITDPGNHAAFLDGLARSIEVAEEFGAGVLIAQSGDDLPGRSRGRQRAALVACLARAADLLKGRNVRLALEPLNTTVDHPGYFLSSTAEALDIIDEVGRPEVRILYDLYHSMVMGEKTEGVLHGRVDRVAHLHIADHPGRHQPGTGHIPLRASLNWLKAAGYQGYAGLEYRPTGSTTDSWREAGTYFAG